MSKVIRDSGKNKDPKDPLSKMEIKKVVLIE
jgi:hypothetical protein